MGFYRSSGHFSHFILANAPSAVLSISNLVKVYERALWSHVRSSEVGLDSKKVDILVPSLSAKEFICACIENACCLTLYKAIARFDALDNGHVYENWNIDAHKVISAWIRELPAILDTRIVPLAYALIRRGFNSVGDTSDESADTTHINGAVESIITITICYVRV